MKICRKCGSEGPFPKHRLVCKKCDAAWRSDWQKRNSEKRREKVNRWRRNNPKKQREYDLRAVYKFSEDDIQYLLTWEGGPCECCGKNLTKIGTGRDEACADHDHETGRFRGVLCGACNRALGLVNDSIETLRKLINYLRINP